MLDGVQCLLSSTSDTENTSNAARSMEVLQAQPFESLYHLQSVCGLKPLREQWWLFQGGRQLIVKAYTFTVPDICVGGSQRGKLGKFFVPFFPKSNQGASSLLVPLSTTRRGSATLSVISAMEWPYWAYGRLFWHVGKVSEPAFLAVQVCGISHKADILLHLSGASWEAACSWLPDKSFSFVLFLLLAASGLVSDQVAFCRLSDGQGDCINLTKRALQKLTLKTSKVRNVRHYTAISVKVKISCLWDYSLT